MVDWTRLLLAHGATLLAALAAGWVYTGVKRRETRLRIWRREEEEVAAGGMYEIVEREEENDEDQQQQQQRQQQATGERHSSGNDIALDITERGRGRSGGDGSESSSYKYNSPRRQKKKKKKKEEEEDGDGVEVDKGNEEEEEEDDEFVLLDRQGDRITTTTSTSTSTSRGAELSVVIPIKGVREHTVRNLRSHLRTDFAGSVEFIIIVQGVEDPAYDAILKEKQSSLNLRHNHELRLLVAGLAAGTSQKIHNMLAGLAACSTHSDYVLFLDDDVQTHPGTFQDQIDAIKNDKSSLFATAYPHDFVPRNASLGSYCVSVYHLPLAIGFSSGTRSSAAYGGCMMFDKEQLLRDRHGILSAWRNGGYSDDMIAGGIARTKGHGIACPDSAILPQRLAGNISMTTAFAYLRRQLYVLDTYPNAAVKRLNHTMLFLYSYASLGIFVPLFVIVFYVIQVSLYVTRALSPTTTGIADAFPRISFVGLVAYLLAGVGSFQSLQFMMSEAEHLCSALSKENVDKSFKRSPVSKEKLFLAFVVMNVAVPLVAFWNLVFSDITWSGIRYSKRHGRIVKVVHM